MLLLSTTEETLRAMRATPRPVIVMTRDKLKRALSKATNCLSVLAMVRTYWSWAICDVVYVYHDNEKDTVEFHVRIISASWIPEE